MILFTVFNLTSMWKSGPRAPRYPSNRQETFNLYCPSSSVHARGGQCLHRILKNLVLKCRASIMHVRSDNFWLTNSLCGVSYLVGVKTKMKKFMTCMMMVWWLNPAHYACCLVSLWWIITKVPLALGSGVPAGRRETQISLAYFDHLPPSPF